MFNLKMWTAAMRINHLRPPPFPIDITTCFTLKDYESKKTDVFPSWVNVGQRKAADARG